MPNRFFSIDDLTDMPEPKWLIDGMFEVNSLVMLAGPPASFKSFMVLDWVLCMATARKWNNRTTTPAKVLYVLGEGKASLLKRIQSWLFYHKIGPESRALLKDSFRVTFDVPQFASKASVDNMLAGLAAENFTPEVIVIDTFARSFVGLDENSQKDTGLWVEQADRLRQAGYTVLFLHHTAKNTEFGLKYRGSTAIMGAMDTAFTLSRAADQENQVVLTCTKQKDHDEGEPAWFQRIIVHPTPMQEGSVVLVPAVRVDERFTQEFREKETKINARVDELIKDPTIPEKRAKARQLASEFGMLETTAYTRINRKMG